jgi:nucleoid DNA-binding protein
MVRRIAAELNVDQVLTRRIVQRTLDSILEALTAEGRIELRDFGVFEIKRRAPRKARNPKTNQEVIVPAKSVLAFQPGKNVAVMIERFERELTAERARERNQPPSAGIGSAVPPATTPPPPAQNA